MPLAKSLPAVGKPQTRYGQCRMPRTDLWNARTADGKAIYTLPETETAPEDVEYASASPDFPSLFAPETPVEMPKIAGTLLYRPVDGGYAAFWNALGEEVAACREAISIIHRRNEVVPHVGQAGWARKKEGGKTTYIATVQLYSIVDDLIKGIDNMGNSSYYLNKNNLINDINNGFEKLLQNSANNSEKYQFKIIFLDTDLIPDLDSCSQPTNCNIKPESIGFPTGDNNISGTTMVEGKEVSVFDGLGNRVYSLSSTPKTPADRIYIRLGSISVDKKLVQKVNSNTEEPKILDTGEWVVIDKQTLTVLRPLAATTITRGRTFPPGYSVPSRTDRLAGATNTGYSRVSIAATTCHIGIGFFGVLSGGILNKEPYLYDTADVIFAIVHELLHTLGLPHPWDTELFPSLIEKEENFDNIRFNVMNSHENNNKNLHIPVSDALNNMTILLEQLQFIDLNPYIKNV